MVRLKVNYNYAIDTKKVISIPYGAIIFTKIQKYFYKTNSI